MIVQCSNCGHSIVVNGLGRKRLDIPLKIVCESLQAHRSIKAVAQELNCSEAYIYSILKANGLRLKDVVTLRQGGEW
jgi:AraC-like DNA-binding protein